jgi:predicted RNA methylase
MPHHHGAADPSLATMLDLDARILHQHLLEVTTWIRRLARDTAGRIVVDLGAGTGTGAVALASTACTSARLKRATPCSRASPSARSSTASPTGSAR